MDFGIVLQTNPPASRVVDLAVKAENHGFTYVWTFDSHILWEEPYVVHSAILAATRKVIVGPMVTNPATRDWTVTASVFATLNEMYGNRTICGIGRGDSAVRVTNGAPTTVAELRDSVHVIRELGNGREVDYKGSTLRFPWGTDSRLEVWIAAYGPKVLALTGAVGDGFILQLADRDIASWTIEAVRKGARDAGRDPAEVKICVAAPAYVTDGSEAGLAYAREQCRWFGGMVGNHVADLVARYGEGGPVPKALTDYIKGREGYDYNEHGRAGNTHTTFVPDEIVDRFCLIGPVEHQLARLEELKELGVDQFSIYLQHDAKDATLDAYGEKVMPRFADAVKARSMSRGGAGAPEVALLGPRRSPWRRRLWRAAMFMASLVLVALAWEAYKAWGPVDGGTLMGVRILPRTTDRAMPHVADMIGGLDDPAVAGVNTTPVWEVVLRGIWYSLRLAFVGFAVGVMVGLALAVLMARFKQAERALLPYLVVSQTVPLLALAPLVVSWGGRVHIGSWEWPRWLSAALLGAFLAFFPVAVGALRGLTSPPAHLLELMASYGCSYRQTLVKLRFPAAIPFLVPALRLAASAAVVGVVVAEISTGLPGGIGRLIIEYARTDNRQPGQGVLGRIRRHGARPGHGRSGHAVRTGHDAQPTDRGPGMSGAT